MKSNSELSPLSSTRSGLTTTTTIKNHHTNTPARKEATKESKAIRKSSKPSQQPIGIHNSSISTTNSTKPSSSTKNSATNSTKPLSSTKNAATNSTKPLSSMKNSATNSTKPLSSTKNAATNCTKPLSPPLTESHHSSKAIQINYNDNNNRKHRSGSFGINGRPKSPPSLVVSKNQGLSPKTIPRRSARSSSSSTSNNNTVSKKNNCLMPSSAEFDFKRQHAVFSPASSHSYTSSHSPEFAVNHHRNCRGGGGGGGGNGFGTMIKNAAAPDGGIYGNHRASPSGILNNHGAASSVELANNALNQKQEARGGGGGGGGNMMIPQMIPCCYSSHIPSRHHHNGRRNNNLADGPFPPSNEINNKKPFLCGVSKRFVRFILIIALFSIGISATVIYVECVYRIVQEEQCFLSKYVLTDVNLANKSRSGGTSRQVGARAVNGRSGRFTFTYVRK